MASRTENGIRLATASLNFAMGVPQSTEYVVDDSLSVREARTDMNLLIEEASTRRPDLMSTELNRRNAETGVGQARADYLPSLNLAGQVDWNSTNVAEAEAKSWAVMAVLQWNLFDGLVTQSKVREAVASAQKMKALEEQTRSSVQLQVRQAFYNLSEAIASRTLDFVT